MGKKISASWFIRKRGEESGINNNLKIISELIIKENEVQAQYVES